MGDDAFVRRDRPGVDLQEVTRGVAAEIERVGEANRLDLLERPKRYERNEQHYCVGVRLGGGRLRLETVEDVRPDPLEDDVAFRDAVNLGRLVAHGRSEAECLANLHHELTIALVRRKICRRDQAGEWSAATRFVVAGWVDDERDMSRVRGEKKP